MKKTFALLFLLMFNMQVFSQNNDTSNIAIPGFNIKFSPLALIELDQSVWQLAFEYSIAQNTSLQHEVGYITFLPNSSYSWDPYDSREQASGFRMKNEIRLYIPAYNNDEATYFAFNVFYKYVDQKYYDREYKETYTQYFEYHRYKNVIGANLVFGFQAAPISRIPLLIDIYGGLGGRYKKLHTSSSDDYSGDYYYFDFWDPREGAYFMPSLTAGIRLGVGFKR